ncbi:MAG: M15 family metallopeptidase [Hyphomicrobiaceae bacterium]|nr:M15 family metallopeptidase [Hyphomicrobiaceae bacterium]
MTKLTTFATNGGAKFTVNAEHGARFQALLNDLEAKGYAIDGKQSGGYNYRNIAGTNKLSEHAHGNAVDVNWSKNARGSKGDIDPALARELAARHGMTWGGDWKNPDPMHFEVAHGQPGHVHVEGETSAPQQQAAVPAQGGDMGWLAMISKTLGGGAGQAPAAAPGGTPAGGGLISGDPNMLAQVMKPMQAQQPMQMGGQGQQPIDMSRLASILSNRTRLGV